ncbi:hypothetical protein BGX29_009573 [Mortierella sp. GBA35]|nr:hypothetical protein BGX29_009573 [Mortierella sp. GBA35]
MQQYDGPHQQQPCAGSIPTYTTTTAHIKHSSSYHTPPSTSPANSKYIPIPTTLVASTKTTETTPPTTPQHCQNNNTSKVSPNTASFSPLPSSALPMATNTPPFDVINHPVKDTLLIVSCLLSKLVHKNDACYNPLRDPITLFHSRAVPRISIEAYLTRILQYIPFTNEVLLNVLVFLDRIGGLEGMQMHQHGLLTPPPQSTTSASTIDATFSSSNSNNRMEGPEISCNLASSLSASSSSATPTVSFNNSDDSATARTTSCTPFTSSCNNSDSSLPMIQKRGREDEPETADDNKRSKNEAASPASIVPLAAVSPVVPEQQQQQPQLTANNGFRINSFNIHRLLITSLMIAAKFTSDLFYSNARYAKVGGLALLELNQLELEFLFTSKFELNVKVDELQRVGNSLLQFRDRHMISSAPIVQHQLHQSQTITMMMRQQQQQLQFQAQLQAQMQTAAAQAQVHAVLALKQQQQAGSLLSPPEEKRPWVETAQDSSDHHQHSYYSHQA